MTFSSLSENIEYFNCCEKVLDTTKKTINSNGYWTGDYRNWNEIVAVCNLEFMLTFGVPIEEKWFVEDPVNPFYTSLNATINYLSSRMFIGSDGSCKFGEDMWDLFRLMNAIKKFHLEKKFKKYRKFADFCTKAIDKCDLEINDRWAGPAVWSVAVEYCLYCGYTKKIQTLIDKILEFRNVDGSWGPLDNPQLNVWHTSQVIRAFSKADVEVDLSIAFDCMKQYAAHNDFVNDYFLKTYYQSYIALAYIYSGKLEDPFFLSIISDFATMVESESVHDRGGLSMIGETFAQFLEHKSRKPSIINHLLRENELEKIEEENKELKEEINRLNKKIEDINNNNKIKKIIYNIIKWVIVTLIAAAIAAIMETTFSKLING